MKKILVKNCLSILCLLTTSLYTNLLFADWTENRSYRNYNPGYGDFPPADINQKLLAQQKKAQKAAIEKAEDGISSQEDNDSTLSTRNNVSPKISDTTTPNPIQQYPVQQYSEQNIQQPANASYDRYRNYAMQRRQEHINRRNRQTGFSGPWNNRGSSFSNPWDNHGSNFSGPWNNRGSNFSTPWNNNGSGFNSPWGDNGSGFSSPWGNNGSGFFPSGNDNGNVWSW